jgi:hypothetical protein
MNTTETHPLLAPLEGPDWHWVDTVPPGRDLALEAPLEISVVHQSIRLGVPVIMRPVTEGLFVPRRFSQEEVGQRQMGIMYGELQVGADSLAAHILSVPRGWRGMRSFYYFTSELEAAAATIRRIPRF